MGTPSYRSEELQEFPILRYAHKSQEETQAFLKASVDHSRFLHQVLTHKDHQNFLEKLFSMTPQTFCAKLIEDLKTFHDTNLSYSLLAKTLRQLRNRSIASIALGDLSGFLTLAQSTMLLSNLAEYSVKTALVFLLRQAKSHGVFVAEKTESDSVKDLLAGYCVLGMGKLGAQELNFSSDIDLIILYDADKIGIKSIERRQETLNKITCKLCALLSDKTPDGQVFRTDLRLRPDPSSHPVAINAATAMIYYEKTGKNWERGAMLKARPIAGDIELGYEFIQNLRPFIWRRNLDFDAIRDIFFLQEQRACRKGAITIPGVDIKLSEGGIRDIEFFVQSLQLVWGGRSPKLRLLRTEEALKTLLEENYIAQKDYDLLWQSYQKLRLIEHRLQMLADEQTHIIPESPEKLESFALFCGYKDSKTFEDHLRTLMQSVWDLFRLQVRTHSPQNTENQAKDVSQKGSPQKGGENLKNISDLRQHLSDLIRHHKEEKWSNRPLLVNEIKKLGYENSEEIVRIVQEWYAYQTRYVANLAVYQNFFLDVVPELLQRFCSSLSPQGTILRFHKFVMRLPTSFPLFSILGSHPKVLEQIIDVMSTAPRIIDYLAVRPVLIDAILAGEYSDLACETQTIQNALALYLEDAKDDEDVLVLARRFLHEHHFLTEMAWLQGSLSQNEAMKRYTFFAQTVLSRCILQAEKSYIGDRQNFAAWSFGRLGGEAMLPESDYDLVFVFDENAEDQQKFFQHYQRLVRKITSFVESNTQEGILGKIDLRLRPYGKAGNLAQSFESIRSYYLDRNAWLVEYMALAKARVIHGSDAMREKLENLREECLRMGFAKDKLAHEISNVLHLVHVEHASDRTKNIKYRRGGLFDLEFLIQYRLLLAAPSIDAPKIPYRTLEQIALIHESGFCNFEEKQLLKDSWKIMTNLLAFERLTGSDLIKSQNNPLIDHALQQMLAMEQSCASALIDRLDVYCDKIYQIMHAEKIVTTY